MSVQIKYGLYDCTRDEALKLEKRPTKLNLNFVFPLDFMKKWKNCGLTSDYLAQYQSYEFKNSRNALILLSTCINELMENAVKFSSDDGKLITILIRHYPKHVEVEAINSTGPDQVKSLAEFVKKLSQSTPEELFFETLEKQDDTGKSSGIGLYSMMKDYDVKLGVKAEPTSKQLDSFQVSIQMQISKAVLANTESEMIAA